MALPLLILPAAVALAGIGLAYHTLAKKPTPVPIPPIQNVPGNPRLDVKPPSPTAPMPQPVVIGTTPAGHPLTVITPINPDTSKPTVVDTLATNGVSVAQAHALFDYLKANGTKDNPTLRDLVTKFQKAYNAEPTTGPSFVALLVNGNYDQPTSTHLTLYTGDPIPPAASTPDPPINPNSPGPAAMSSSNLYAYLKTKGNDRSAILKSMVKRFQHDVNTDPQYPGPASQTGVKLIKTKLVEDGVYGKGTSDALAVVTFERINP